MGTSGITRLFPRAEFFPWDRAILRAFQLENGGGTKKGRKKSTSPTLKSKHPRPKERCPRRANATIKRLREKQDQTLKVGQAAGSAVQLLAPGWDLFFSFPVSKWLLPAVPSRGHRRQTRRHGTLPGQSGTGATNSINKQGIKEEKTPLGIGQLDGKGGKKRRKTPTWKGNWDACSTMLR